MSSYTLKLYVTGQSPNSIRAVANLRDIFETHLSKEYRLEIIDIKDSPEVAAEAGVIATPTLVRNVPPPLRKVIGDLSDTESVLFGLGLTVNRSEKKSGSE